MLSPFLNGCAVFAAKHALALAHASGGGKCKRRVSVRFWPYRQLDFSVSRCPCERYGFS
jgi:hypothetical protein